MKKIVALILAMCLLTGFALAEAVEINWEDVEGSVAEAGIEGDFADIADLGIRMFVPSVFQEVELSEAEIGGGYIFLMSTEDQSANVAAYYVSADGMTLEDFGAALSEAGAEDVELVTVNGIPVVTYEQPATDSMNVGMLTDADNLVIFVFEPASDEGFQSVAAIMTASIQAA